jgi:flagellar assembly protein FliH
MARVIKAENQSDASAGGTVLRLTDFVAEARAVVLEARKEAARIVAEARAKAEQAEQAAAGRGYEEGFARGRNDGYTDGCQAGSRQGLEASAGAAGGALSCAQRIAEELTAARGELLEQARRELLDLAVAVAERVVGVVAARDVAAAQANLVKVLEMAGYAKAITIKVNPLQLQALREHCRQAVEALAIKGRVELVGDPSISPGGVKLLTGGGQIDATIETQLAYVVEALVGPAMTDMGRYESHSREKTDHPHSQVAPHETKDGRF